MKTGATFSKNRKYRYILWRIWDDKKPLIMFIGLNPSIADETKNDPTITRCINYAKDWVYGGVYVGNIFAYCSTSPTNLYKIDEPIGRDNDKWLFDTSRKAKKIIAVWGNHGKLKNKGNGRQHRQDCTGFYKGFKRNSV
jgi:hypothetical protein